jgi:hypothetical protein
MGAASLQAQARFLPPGRVAHRVGIWHSRLQAERNRVALMDLYKGEHWSQTRDLMQVAVKAGFSPELWVASAGLGLQPVSKSFPPYAATFSAGHADSVAATGVDRRHWWNSLQGLMGTSSAADLGARRSVLLVLSEVYGSVLQGELRELGQCNDDVVLVGGADQIQGIHRVPANGALRRALGGTLTGLNVRMATSWLEHCTDGMLTSDETIGSWSRWATASEHLERYNRQPMTDAQIKEFIRRSVAKQPDLSRTSLHRLLRESGKACEQKRFANLYVETMGER